MLTVRYLREALSDAPEWRPVFLGVETDDGELDLDAVEDYGRFDDGEVSVLLVGRHHSRRES